MVLANELLDNLPFRLAVFDGGWQEAFVDVDARRSLRGGPGALPPPCPPACPAVAPHGARAPVQDAAAAWVRDALGSAAALAACVVIDYARTTAEMAARAVAGVAADLSSAPARRALPRRPRHARTSRPTSPSTSCRRPSAVRTQADFLAAHGIDDLVEEGRRRWAAQAAAPDLAALSARSRVREAEALTDPAGLGGFIVAEWMVPAGWPTDRTGARGATPH